MTCRIFSRDHSKRGRSHRYLWRLLTLRQEYFRSGCIRRDNSVCPVTTAFFVFPPSKQKPLVKGPFHTVVLWSGTNFHTTTAVHSQKPHSSKPSKPICLARTTSLTVFVLFATPVAGWVSRLSYIFCAPLPPLPHFCRFWSVSLAAVLLLAAFACFVVVVVVVLLYAVLLWSASSLNEMGRSRSLYYYYFYYYYYYYYYYIEGGDRERDRDIEI